ncbi:DUF3298 and DUF4163 domain-containing protein [Flavobacterium succinicans]|uniref:DUF3298/DUF4163 domain-containing protein n=1 Tax=Flavobacterium succinicans TaxID=29536 RepID=A0A199XPB8_9FLAO|nr:DUF3298 and DUF4163 domain-containing protein [Flavobacterium succinicans]OAZ03495.1 hypothetical protein FLB_22840 [Flavobacterium succinicans]
MKRYIQSLLLLIVLSSCSNELNFENKKFNKKSTLLCKQNCTEIKVTIPIAKSNGRVADSINKKIFSIVKELVYLDEKPLTKEDYEALVSSFIQTFETTKEAFPDSTFGWEANIEGTIKYQSENLINIEIDHYTFTGGAHGYEGLQSLLFDPKTGKTIPIDKLFQNLVELKKMVEKKFRVKYQIPQKGSINQTGYLFEDETFQLPKNIIFTNDGLLFHYNQYEAAAYVEGPKTLFIPYASLKNYLILK